MKNNRKGFTIVELVIVIAVIAVLAAVLIPTFSGVLGKANASAAQQLAMNGIKAGLLMTNTASLPNSFVTVDSDKNGTPDYVYQYTGNTMNAQEAYDADGKFITTNFKKANTLLVSEKAIVTKDGSLNALEGTDAWVYSGKLYTAQADANTAAGDDTAHVKAVKYFAVTDIFKFVINTANGNFIPTNAKAVATTYANIKPDTETQAAVYAVKTDAGFDLYVNHANYDGALETTPEVAPKTIQFEYSVFTSVDIAEEVVIFVEMN